MKCSKKILIAYSIGVTDGQIRKVKEFYFDYKSSTIRYFIAETGYSLYGRKILIAPQALLTQDWMKEIFSVFLNKEQIKYFPNCHKQKSILPPEEIILYENYPWTAC